MYNQEINTSTRYTNQIQFYSNTIGEHGGYRIKKQPIWVARPFKHNPIWSRLGQCFDLEHFLNPALPVDLGHIKLVHPVERVRVLRTPIKMGGDETIYLPKEIEFVLPLLEHVLETEVSVNENFLYNFGHITVEHTYIDAGATQRAPGWHVDGFQGTRQSAHAAEHSYLWCSVQPAEFCVQPFFLNHLDSSRHQVFAEFERQANECNVLSALEQHVYLIDPYLVHRSTAMSSSGWRTFVRITFSDIELEDPMNTINRLIPLAQNYEPRIDHRDRLYVYEQEFDLYPYGVRK